MARWIAREVLLGKVKLKHITDQKLSGAWQQIRGLFVYFASSEGELSEAHCCLTQT